jgi:hypothetical protein
MNTTPKPLQAVTLVLDGARGRYIPRDFVSDDKWGFDLEHCASWGLTDANCRSWEAAKNPDSDWYWDAWAWILDNAKYTDESGNVYTLYQDGDLFALCYERMTDDEKSNFGFEV